MNLRYYGHSLLFATSLLLAACASPTVHTDEDRNTLGLTRTVWVTADADQRNVPVGASGIWTQIGKHVESKLATAGFQIAANQQSADATLSIYIHFVYFRPLTPNATNLPPNTRYMRIGVQLTHRKLGKLIDNSELSAPPYHSTYVNTALIRNIDSNILWALYKVRDSRLIRDTCPKLNYNGPRPTTRVEAKVRVHVAAAGLATNAELLSSTGHPELDRAAVVVFRGCRYSPAYKDGKPVAEVDTFTYEYGP